MADFTDIRMEDLPPAYRAVAEVIGIDAAVALVESHGGDAIYVPKMDSVSRAARDRAIRAAFNGANHRELARRHDLTTSMIRVIVSGSSSACENQVEGIRQLKLF